MITSFNNKLFDLTGQMNAVALNKINAVKNETLKVHIPKIMPQIPQGDPQITILQTKGYSVFKNANKKPAISGSIIREKNYFETSFNSVSNIDDLDELTKKLIKELNEYVTEFAHTNLLRPINRKKKLKYEVKKDTPLRVEFLNGKINHLAFILMDQTESKKELEDE